MGVSVHHANRFSPSIATTSARWWTYVRRGRVLCPRGHHLPNKFRVPESGLIRCDKAGGSCDAWLFLYAIRGGGIVVVEAKPDDLAHLEAFATPAEALEYLGIFPT